MINIITLIVLICLSCNEAFSQSYSLKLEGDQIVDTSEAVVLDTCDFDLLVVTEDGTITLNVVDATETFYFTNGISKWFAFKRPSEMSWKVQRLRRCSQCAFVTIDVYRKDRKSISFYTSYKKAEAVANGLNRVDRFVPDILTIDTDSCYY